MSDIVREVPVKIHCPRDLTEHTIYIRTIMGKSRADSIALSNGCDFLNGCDVCEACLRKYSSMDFVPDLSVIPRPPY